MCGRISDSVAFWWSPATLSKETKFLVLETSCITHTHAHTHTHTHTHIYIHTQAFLAIILYLPAAWNEYIFKLICTKTKNGGGV